jgi:hypothetical protein
MNAVIPQTWFLHGREIAPPAPWEPTIPITLPWRTPVAMSEEQCVLSRLERGVFLSFGRVTFYRLPLEVEFLMLALQWKQDTLFESSPWRMAAHPAYQRIIGMGRRAVSLILQHLSREADFWFEALVAITGEQPVLPEHAGNLEAMRQDWLRWGREHGYDC